MHSFTPPVVCAVVDGWRYAPARPNPVVVGASPAEVTVVMPACVTESNVASRVAETFAAIAWVVTGEPAGVAPLSTGPPIAKMRTLGAQESSAKHHVLSGSPSTPPRACHAPAEYS